jgi:hypothetical protein
MSDEKPDSTDAGSSNYMDADEGYEEKQPPPSVEEQPQDLDAGTSDYGRRPEDD